jgi:hypothetical protein
MASYAVPVLESPTPVAAGEVLPIASGDLRQSANKVCWAAQSEVEKQLNHLNVAYAPTSQIADHALAAKAAMMADLGIRVHLCGD